MTERIITATLCVSSTICLWSAFLLTYDWQGVRQRRWLALALLFWGLSWAYRAFGLIFGNMVAMYREVLPPVLIIAGIVCSVTFLLWPLSVVTPKKFGLRKCLLFCAPFLLCISIYWGVIGLFGLQRFTFTSLGDFWNHISYFSVWYRLVMCACLIGYLVFTMNRTLYYIRNYNNYVEQNCSEYDRYTIRWIPLYLAGLVTISVFYFINLCVASLTTFWLHNVVACLFMAWLTAKTMVYNSPFTADTVSSTVTEPAFAKGEDFNSQFDRYKRHIEMWMMTDRPYLDANFSLQEVMTRFRLNRTYASRIFNDGFGKSFLLVVREYRIEYARSIIEKNPDIAMSEVAHLCGYSTAQAFHKAFAFCNDGLTPGKYAQTCAKKIRTDSATGPNDDEETL